MKLQSKRLFIRPVEIKDAGALFDYKSSKEITKFQGRVYNRIDEIEELIHNNPSNINIENTWYQLVIIENKKRQIAGDIGLHFLGPENMQVELGITISPNFQKMGVAGESIKLVLDYLFNELKKHRVFVSIDPENTPSLALFQSLNFRKEAHHKESYLQNGIWKDDLIYAMLRSEHKL